MVLGYNIRISGITEQQNTTKSDGPKDTPWPMKCHDNHHTSQSPYSTAHIDGLEKWRFYSSGWVESGIAIDSDGTLYFKGAYNHLDRYIYAVYPDGTEKWKYKTDGLILGSSPAIAEDGTIYIDSWDDYLHAVNPDGTRKWRFCAHDDIASSPAIAEDGTIYFGTMLSGNNIYAVNPNGTEKWRKKVANKWVESSPSIGEDGTVYIGSSSEWGGYLHAFGPVESNEPPGTPTISGETKGWAGKSYWYTFKSIDPDNNPIRFYIDWGDGNEGWTTYEHASGENCYYEHAWSERDEYTIRCKAKDVMGEESDWAELTVSMPRNRATYNSLFLRFLEQFPILQKILSYIL